jgi:hypothetical protein
VKNGTEYSPANATNQTCNAAAAPGNVGYCSSQD